jgi:hypothetical protein
VSGKEIRVIAVLLHSARNPQKAMPIGKIVLTTGLVFLLLAALIIGGGGYWWSKNKNEVLGQFMAARKEFLGQLTEERREWIAFGRSTDNRGCFAQSLQHHDRCGSFPCHLKNNLFLLQCLKESVPTPGFCDEVPAKTEFMKTVAWRAGSCSETNREGSYCHELFGTLQEFCGPRL